MREESEKFVHEIIHPNSVRSSLIFKSADFFTSTRG